MENSLSQRSLLSKSGVGIALILLLLWLFLRMAAAGISANVATGKPPVKISCSEVPADYGLPQGFKYFQAPSSLRLLDLTVMTVEANPVRAAQLVLRQIPVSIDDQTLWVWHEETLYIESGMEARDFETSLRFEADRLLSRSGNPVLRMVPTANKGSRLARFLNGRNIVGSTRLFRERKLQEFQIYSCD